MYVYVCIKSSLEYLNLDDKSAKPYAHLLNTAVAFLTISFLIFSHRFISDSLLCPSAMHFKCL